MQHPRNEPVQIRDDRPGHQAEAERKSRLQKRKLYLKSMLRSTILSGLVCSCFRNPYLIPFPLLFLLYLLLEYV